jgi:hypothetical protein
MEDDGDIRPIHRSLNGNSRPLLQRGSMPIIGKPRESDSLAKAAEDKPGLTRGSKPVPQLATHRSSGESIESKGSVPHGEWHLLHLAAWEGDTEKVPKLLKTVASPDLSGPSGDTPLLLAVQRGNQTVVSQLLAAGASIDKENDVCV